MNYYQLTIEINKQFTLLDQIVRFVANYNDASRKDQMVRLAGGPADCFMQDELSGIACLAYFIKFNRICYPAITGESVIMSEEPSRIIIRDVDETILAVVSVKDVCPIGTETNLRNDDLGPM